LFGGHRVRDERERQMMTKEKTVKIERG